MAQTLIQQGTYQSDIDITLSELDPRRCEFEITMDHVPCMTPPAGDPPMPGYSRADLATNIYSPGGTIVELTDNGDNTVRLRIVVNTVMKRPGSAGLRQVIK